jgi:hypothetical protein
MSAMGRGPMGWREKGASYPGLEIIAKLATVFEVQPAELVKMAGRQPLDREPAQQVGINLVRRRRLACIRALVDRRQPQQSHRAPAPACG